MNRVAHKPRLLLFNLATDTDDPVLGFTTAWINSLAGYCEYIDVITMRAGSLAVAGNVRVFSVGKEHGYAEPRRLIKFYRVLSSLLAERSYDACFAHMMPLFAILGYPLLQPRRVPITLWYAHKSVTWLLRLAEKLVKRIVTASPESFRIKSSKVMILGHGIDTDAFEPSPERGPSNQVFTIISVGRISAIKRLELLIEAAKILVEDGVANFQVRLVGGVPPGGQTYAERLHGLVAEYSLESIIRFAGHVPFERVVTEYQNADVMVNLSMTGSVDKAILEAMSCGLPVITSNEAFNEILRDWGDLLLVPAGKPDVLSTRLRHLMLMPVSDRLVLGKQLRHEVEANHNLSKLAEMLISCFTSDTQTG
jgi:glycosyltransferase involved in cell wall biosynthesis